MRPPTADAAAASSDDASDVCALPLPAPCAPTTAPAVGLAAAAPRALAPRPAAWPARAAQVERPPVGLGGVLGRWQAQARTGQRPNQGFVGTQVQPPQRAQTVPFPAGLHPAVCAGLKQRGMDVLYSHQAEAFLQAQKGAHVVVATPTASGKSLAYNLPIFDALSRAPDVRALYLFPTKALARDQEEALKRQVRALAPLAGEVSQAILTYDGDTPAEVRRQARTAANLILTNPDMLHSGILPHHTAWARFFSGLRYVVLDELHVLRGVFGSHMANVLRRLVRVAAFYGAQPQFLLASATIGNAKAHAEALLGQPVTLVADSGAPQGQRHIMVYNPPIVHEALGIRQGVIKATVRLACELLRARVPTLVFGQSRRSVEIMLKYLRDFAAQDPSLPASAIMSYRGGYLPNARRAIERDLRDGNILCVVATQALELGIDIGSLDAVLCAGWPGSLAALWQRFGRGGRRNAQSLAILVTSNAPIDQYFALQPQLLWQAPIEEARIDANNAEILVQHIKCAAFELPFGSHETFGNVGHAATQDSLHFLADHQLLHCVAAPTAAAPDTQAPATYHWAAGSYPANEVSLRLIGWDNFVIIDVGSDKTIAEMDWRSTHVMLHEQAIYQHAGEQWQVEKLDFDNRKAFVRKVEPDYYTEANTHVKITTLEIEQQTHAPWPHASQLLVQFGEVSVVEKVVGFKKIRFHSHENVGYGEVHLPEMQLHTTSLMLEVPGQFLLEVGAPLGAGLPQMLDALRGLGHAMHLVASVGLMTSPQDLGFSLEEGQRQAAAQAWDCAPRLYLYDKMPGGVGLAERAYNQCQLLLQQTQALLLGCPCAEGCPACVGAQEVRLPQHRKGLAAALFAAWRLPPLQTAAGATTHPAVQVHTAETQALTP